MKNFAVREFTGGMNNHISARLLSENTAQLISNGEVSTGALKSIQDVEYSGSTDPEGLGHYGASNRSVVQWYGRSYWSINDAEGSPYYGGNEAVPGITPPSAPPVVVAYGTGLTGTYRYCWTYVNANGFESAPGTGDTWFDLIVLTNEGGRYTVPTLPSGVSSIRIYRTVDEGNDFYYVNEHDSDDSGMSFTDTTSDLDIMMRETMATQYHFPPPDEGKYLTEYDGVFFVAVDDRLYFSEVGNPHAWKLLNWIGIGDTITGICNGFSGILVFTANRTNLVTGTDATTIMRTELPSNQGCPNYRTIAYILNAPLWISNDGLCMWDGQQVHLLSHGRYEINFTPLHAVSGNDRYYLFHDSGAMCFDRRSQDVFRELDLTCSYAWYDGDGDVLYFLKDDGKIYVFGGDDMQVNYSSPEFGGSAITLKQGRRIFLDATGDIEATFRVDGDAQSSITFKGRRRRWEYLPSSIYGRTFQVDLSFSGTLYEYMIEYDERMN